MAFSIIILALSLSLDALGVGIAYGLRKVRIPFLSTACICMFSILYSGIAVYFGKYLSLFIPQKAGNIIGTLILLFMGCWIIVQGLLKTINSNISKVDEKDKKDTIIKVVIKSLGITIQVLRNPTECDFDKSGTIDLRESLLLGLALSIDAIGVGIGGALSGFHSMYIPLAVGLFQLVFLSMGKYLGRKMSTFEKVNERVMAIIPGVLLIILALIKIY